MVQCLKRKPYEERLKILGMYTLQKRRIRGDLIDTYNTLTGKKRVDSQIFLQLATDTHSLPGHSKKLFVPICSTTARGQVILQHESDQQLECVATTCSRCTIDKWGLYHDGHSNENVKKQRRTFKKSLNSPFCT